MMATGDNAMQLLVQKLKQRFPEIPEHEVYACAQKYPYDPHLCEQMLSQKSSLYMYGPFSELSVNVKPEQDFLSKPVDANFHIQHRQTSRYSGLVSISGHNGDSSTANARFRNENANFHQSPYESRTSNVRSVSVSGLSPHVNASSGFQAASPSSSRIPKSAPVMSNAYEPFQSFEHNRQGQFYGLPNSTSPMPMSMPQGGGLPLYAQQGMYQGMYGQQFYELHVSCQAQVTNQRAQMERLHQKLMTDKDMLNTLKMECASMEKELAKRTRPAHSILPHEEIQKLKEETNRLRIEVATMSREVDTLFKGQVPLGETSEKNLLALITPKSEGAVKKPDSRPFRHVPPPPFPHVAPPSSNDDEGHQWSCSTCTFLNNPALDKCEICEMPRIMLAAGYS